MDYREIGLQFKNKKAKLGNKVMSLHDAVKKFINDGDCVTICGGSGMISTPILHEIIRQKKRDLTISADGTVENLDILVGAGCVKRAEFGYSGTGLGSLCQNIRRSVEEGVPHKIEIEDYSNLSMTLRFFAGALGLPFIPIRSIRGSSIEEKRTWRKDKKLSVMKSPFTGEEVVVVPPCIPDVAFTHAHQADENGNTQIWGMIGYDDWATFASKKVIVTVERIVDVKEISKDPNKTLIPGFTVDAVVEAPFGAHPYPSLGFYQFDFEFISMYINMSKSREDFLKFLDEWVFGLKDHNEYIDKLGKERLEKLRMG
jgi:glutaconate CoA-transferase subunit A